MKRNCIIFAALLFVIAVMLCACGVFHSHKYSEWTVTRASTCSLAGVRERKCSCGMVESALLPPAEHAYGEWVIVKAAICNREGVSERVCADCGAREQDFLPTIEHNYKDTGEGFPATCKTVGAQKLVCVDCGVISVVEIPKFEHTWVYDKCFRLKCTVCGSFTFNPDDSHTFADATCDLPQICTVCGATEGKPLGHAPGADGICRRCGKFA